MNFLIPFAFSLPSIPPPTPVRRELTQCQFCIKSKVSGVALRKDAVLTSVISVFSSDFQSKDCQRSAWKTHEAKCALNQRTKLQMPMIEGPVSALNVLADPSRAERDVIMISLKPRIGSTCLATAFTITVISVVPIAAFPTAQEMRSQLKQVSDDSRRFRMAGAIFVPQGPLMYVDSMLSVPNRLFAQQPLEPSDG
ncbi:hypothetical protein B0H19DRAFT_1245393 [Mycena capillaripes]|nr:hypothetical protein B0H19DRAFT_1245393 [Mycena capillaripes]